MSAASSAVEIKPGSAPGAPSTPDAPPAWAGSVCPYCGEEIPAGETTACPACRGLFEPLSRQATQNTMGPWQLRDGRSAYLPGCSYEVIKTLASRGRITPATVVRGPTTRQFWRRAAATPGLAHLLGLCHACAAAVRASDVLCVSCGARFDAPDDRQHLGLGPIRPLTTPPTVRTAPDAETISASPRPHRHPSADSTNNHLSVFERQEAGGVVPRPRSARGQWLIAGAIVVGALVLAALTIASVRR